MDKPIKYLTLQNKALHQGLYLAYVQLPSAPIPYTTNGHIMVRGKVWEVKALKSQEDKRNDKQVSALTDRRWLDDFKDMTPAEPTPSYSNDDIVEANSKGETYTYQKIYVQYIMARYPVAEWKIGGKNLVAVDTQDNIIGVIAPITPPVKKEEVKRKVKETEERGNA